jgi:hypothetical protein
MTNPKTCDACGDELRGGISIGGTILCRKCAPEIESEIEETRAAGKPVSAARIAAMRRKETLHSYILRDIPPPVWEQVQAVSARRGQTAKDFILAAISAALSNP